MTKMNEHCLLARWAPSVVVLILSAVIIVLLRLATAEEPLERDIVIHATIAHEAMLGRSLYSDLWNHKPPGSFLVHAALIWLLGFSPFYVLVLNILFNILTLVGVYVLAYLMSRSRLAAAIAGLLWALLSFDIMLQANQPNSEALVNPMLVFAVALWYAITKRALAWPWIIVVGLLLLLASLFKQHLVLIPAALAIAFCAVALTRDRAELTRSVALTAAAAGIGVIGWLSVFSWFYSQGALGDFIDAAFRYNRDYGGSLRWMVGKSLAVLQKDYIHGILPYFGATAAFVTIAITRHNWMLAAVITALFIGIYLAVSLPGKFFPHYFQLYLPFLAVVGGLLVDALVQNRNQAARVTGVAVFLMLMTYTGGRTLEFLQYPPAALEMLKYQSQRFGEAKAVGELIGRALPSKTRVFYLGEEPSLFLYGDLRPVNGKLYSYWFVRPNQFRQSLLDATIREFEQGDFNVVVLAVSPEAIGADRIASLLRKDFALLPACVKGNQIWARPGSSEHQSLASVLQAVAVGSPGRAATEEKRCVSP